mmetsp:Transcript_95265/g.164406  ORF Transcript_95265/g.164406 Transcript_95265/m.164406 type:complete len:317 (-) Transcript_95265:901-1851(-)
MLGLELQAQFLLCTLPLCGVLPFGLQHLEQCHLALGPLMDLILQGGRGGLQPADLDLQLSLPRGDGCGLFKGRHLGRLLLLEEIGRLFGLLEELLHMLEEVSLALGGHLGLREKVCRLLRGDPGLGLGLSPGLCLLLEKNGRPFSLGGEFLQLDPQLRLQCLALRAFILVHQAQELAQVVRLPRRPLGLDPLPQQLPELAVQPRPVLHEGADRFLEPGRGLLLGRQLLLEGRLAPEVLLDLPLHLGAVPRRALQLLPYLPLLRQLRQQGLALGPLGLQQGVRLVPLRPLDSELHLPVLQLLLHVLLLALQVLHLPA